MKDKSNKAKTATESSAPRAESQSERRLKYGANVVVAVVAMIALGILLILIAQKQNLRHDTTAGRSQSLKDQTLSIIRELESRTRLRLAQQVMQDELSRTVTRLESVTEPAPATAPTTQPAAPATRLVPAAQVLRDKLNAAVTLTGDELDKASPDSRAVLEKLRSALVEAVAEGEKALKQSPPPADKAARIQSAIAAVNAQIKRIAEFKPEVKLVGLFSTVRYEQEKKVEEEDPRLRFQQVADVLGEFQKRSGGLIKTEMIDSVEQPAKVEQLFTEVAEKYNNDIKIYREVMAAYEPTFQTIQESANRETQALSKLPEVTDRNDRVGQTLDQVNMTLQGFALVLGEIKKGVQRELDLKVPNYAGAADGIRAGLGGLNSQLEAILSHFTKMAATPNLLPAYKQYLAEARPRLEAMKKTCDDLLDRMKDLGPIRQIDELRENKSNSIVVMTPTDLKAIPQDKIFQAVKSRMFDSDGKIRPRFSGEQQITKTLWKLTSTKPTTIAFIRGGGPPLTVSIPRMSRAPMQLLASELSEWNFRVIEKDITDMWAMQSQQMMQQLMQRGIMLPPEATEEELKNVPWVVFSSPAEGPMGMGQMGKKVQAHLDAGGSALIMADFMSERMDFLRDWGIDTAPSRMIIHEKVTASGGKKDDFWENIARQQPVFMLDNYGQHPVTSPLRSLDGLFFLLTPVSTTTPQDKDTRVTPLMPIPASPRPWSDTEGEKLFQDSDEPIAFSTKKDLKLDSGEKLGTIDSVNTSDEKNPTATIKVGADDVIEDDVVSLRDPSKTAGAFDASVGTGTVSKVENGVATIKVSGTRPERPVKAGDIVMGRRMPRQIPGPLWAGAAAEKGKQRLIVLGGSRFLESGLIAEVDSDVRNAQRIAAPRFPANGELFINSAFWLSRMDNMLGLSPSVFDVARINPQMSRGAENTWNILMAGGLPALAFLCGLMVWLKRRD